MEGLFTAFIKGANCIYKGCYFRFCEPRFLYTNTLFVRIVCTVCTVCIVSTQNRPRESLYNRFYGVPRVNLHVGTEPLLDPLKCDYGALFNSPYQKPLKKGC